MVDPQTITWSSSVRATMIFVSVAAEKVDFGYAEPSAATPAVWAAVTPGPGLGVALQVADGLGEGWTAPEEPLEEPPELTETSAPTMVVDPSGPNVETIEEFELVPPVEPGTTTRRLAPADELGLPAASGFAAAFDLFEVVAPPETVWVAEEPGATVAVTPAPASVP